MILDNTLYTLEFKLLANILFEISEQSLESHVALFSLASCIYIFRVISL